MFRLLQPAWQWNSNQFLHVDGDGITAVHFQHEDMHFAVVKPEDSSLDVTVDENVCIDHAGNYPQTISFVYDGEQWDPDTLFEHGISVSGDPQPGEILVLEISPVCSMPVIDHKVQIPNRIFQTAGRVDVFAFVEDKTLRCESFEIQGRVKPPEYVYVNTPTLLYPRIAELVNEMEFLRSKFGNLSASVDAGIGTPSVDVTELADGWDFAFHNLKGEKGEKGDTGEKGERGDVNFATFSVNARGELEMKYNVEMNVDFAINSDGYLEVII